MYGNVTANKELIVTGNIEVVAGVKSNLIPITDDTYDLGNATNRWRDLYLTGNTLFLGNANISASGNGIAVESLDITGIGNIGNIASINLDGNAGNILYGNGVFAGVTTPPLSGDGGNISNIAGANVTGNVSSANVANVANLVVISNANAGTSGTFYPIFVSNTGNGALQLDNVGSTITYNPSTSTLTFNTAKVERTGNDGGGENIDYDGSNNSIRMSVTGAANALVVSNSSTSIQTANINNTNLIKFNETYSNGGNVSGTLTPDAAAATIFNYTLTGNITLSSLANASAGTSMTIILNQDGTGNRTLTSTMKFAGNVNTLSTAANSIDVMSVFYDGTTYYASLTKGYV
jgi:hypothetical protein